MSQIYYDTLVHVDWLSGISQHAIVAKEVRIFEFGFCWTTNSLCLNDIAIFIDNNCENLDFSLTLARFFKLIVADREYYRVVTH